MSDSWLGRAFRRGPTRPTWGDRPHFTRYVMYGRLKEVVAEHIDRSGGSGLTVLSISRSKYFAGHIGLEKAEFVEANYPDYNLLSLPFPDNEFDVVLSDQVLEHIEGDPFVAVNESVRVTRPGGHIIHTTCFFNEIHGHPLDFWRFTPEALRLLCRGVADPVEVGGWGNMSLIPVTWLRLRFRPVPSSRWHPLHRLAVRNNPLLPVTTWIVARKPEEQHEKSPGAQLP